MNYRWACIFMILGLNACSNTSANSPSNLTNTNRVAQVGSYAVYENTENKNGVITKTHNTVTIKSVVNAKVILETEHIDSNGQSWTSRGETDSSIFTAGQDALKICEVHNSPLETITVQGGTFQTCKIQSVESTGKFVAYYWYGDVPFANVKSETTYTDRVVITELISFQY